MRPVDSELLKLVAHMALLDRLEMVPVSGGRCWYHRPRPHGSLDGLWPINRVTHLGGEYTQECSDQGLWLRVTILMARAEGTSLMEEPTFASLEFRHKNRPMRRERFLERMAVLAPWAALETRVKLFSPSRGADGGPIR